MFLWDLISERLELLWSNVESFLNIFLSGNGTVARTMTDSLMDKFIPMCLSPLFRIPHTSSAAILANKSSLVNQSRSDGQNSIQAYYSVLYAQLNAADGTQNETFIGNFFSQLYHPHTYKDDNTFRKPLTNAAVSFVDAVMANGNTPNIDYQGVNYETLVGAEAALSKRFEQIVRMNLDNISSLRTYMVGSVLKERDNEMADWIRDALMDTLPDDVRYEVVRKVIMSVYSSNLVFHYLFRTSIDARKEIANHTLDYAAVFCDVHSDPLSTGLNPAIMKRAQRVFYSSNPLPEETAQSSSVDPTNPQPPTKAPPTDAEKKTASYRPKRVLYVTKYIESLGKGQQAQFDKANFRNPKFKSGENDKRAVKTLAFKKVADFRPPVYRKRQPKRKEAASRPESAVSTASKGGGKGDAGKKSEAGGKVDNKLGRPVTAKEIKQSINAGTPVRVRKTRPKSVTRRM
jgi:hypothetical protein